ncbi:hypothetical protein HYX09_03590 [Candidatus Woesearchaeota archaeon]|nr:hypothetical protein [Candidatus Woesearchaeota archaeon]
MERLLMVGGVPYSGKTYFCRRLKETDPGRYLDLGFDRVLDLLQRDPQEFFNCFGFMEPLLGQIRQMPSIGEALRVEYPGARQEALKGALIKMRAGDLWMGILKQEALVYISEKVLNAGDDSVPMVESLLYTEAVRMLFYQSLKDWLEMLQSSESARPTSRYFDIDRARKTLIYLDFGLEAALARYAKEKDRKPGVDGGTIFDIHSQQQIPDAGEWPNLEVIVIRDQVQFDRQFNAVASVQ